MLACQLWASSYRGALPEAMTPPTHLKGSSRGSLRVTWRGACLDTAPASVAAPAGASTSRALAPSCWDGPSSRAISCALLLATWRASWCRRVASAAVPCGPSSAGWGQCLEGSYREGLWEGLRLGLGPPQGLEGFEKGSGLD